MRTTREDRIRIKELSEQVGRELATKTVLFHHAMATRLGLSVTDLKCLDLLRQTDKPLTPSNLVASTGLTGGAITGVADRLEAAGFVERVRDPEDRRRWELRPRPERQAEIAHLFEPLGAAMAELCAGYSDKELEMLTGFLTRLRVIMDAQTERLRHWSATDAVGLVDGGPVSTHRGLAATTDAAKAIWRWVREAWLDWAVPKWSEGCGFDTFQTI